jgi:surface protein
MSSMFSSATSFDQDIGSWDVTSLINAISMFTGVTLSTANYESLLVGWNAQALNMGVAFDGGNSTYCSDAATLARANMIATFNWTITDGGQDCPPQPTHYFVTTWKTDNPGTSDQFSITVPMIGDLYDVDWNNDGIFDEFGLSGPVTHNFGVVDTYTIRIKGFYDSIRFNNDGDRLKILSIDQWGTQSWTSMNAAFWGAANLVVPATDTPDFSAVEDMTAMFTNATSANPDTSGWDTSAVTSMALMFRSASAANPDVSGWDTSEVITMGFMFQFASSFDQDIGSWDVTSLTTATGMLTGAALSTTNYDSLLIGWDAQALNMGVTFSGGNSVYCSAPAVAARANMIASDGWVITDGGQCVPDEIFASSFEAGE